MSTGINVVKQPRVSVISRPQFIEPEHLKTNFLGDASDSERVCEFAGRLCYMSQNNTSNKTTHDYITNILQQGHGSVLEHGVFVLLIEGVSRSCTHEMVRHRAGFGYSQLSQRYVDESNAVFVMPPAIIDNKDLEITWEQQMTLAQQTYISLVENLLLFYQNVTDKTHRRKLAREAARSVLPNATETKIVVSGNIRAWRTMLELRCSEGAEREIRRLGIEILNVMKRESPSAFSDFEVYISPTDGYQAARCKYHKV